MEEVRTRAVREGPVEGPVEGSCSGPCRGPCRGRALQTFSAMQPRATDILSRMEDHQPSCVGKFKRS